MESKKSYTSYGTCRFCSLKGQHKDIFKEYYWNGCKEVYLDMILECFNIFLTPSNALSSLVCSSCVSKLRDASSFRSMVVSSEQQLLNAFSDKETIFVNVPVGDHDLDIADNIKTEDQVEVKQEVQEGDLYEDIVYDSDYNPDGEEFCDISSKGDPTSDDAPVDGEAALLAKFPRGTLKVPTRESLYRSCPDYFRHLELLKGKIILPRMIQKLLEDAEREQASLKRRRVYITEKMAHILNASTLLENSNATPFKSRNRSGFPCFYCRAFIEDLDGLKQHQSQQHRRSEIKRVLSAYGAESLVVYVDVTDLKCTLCDEMIHGLAELKAHLTRVHKTRFHSEYPDRVVPFKLSADNVYECQLCGFKFETFGSIERHMNVHYRNYVCTKCGAGFVTRYRLKVHTKSMHLGGSFPCELCGRVYGTQQKLKGHVDTVHRLLKRFKCPKCPERFSEYFRRQKHLVERHGVAPLQYKCNVCDKSFDRRYTLSRHLKRDHLEERDYGCQLCPYKCFTNNELRVHMVKHNGERIFECTVCKKCYARKKTLKEHMRIHNNDRRFSCALCGQAFVQKCSLKGHIKTHHMEYSMQ